MKAIRQSVQNRVIHWGIALSIFGLIITGMFEMPLAKRYKIVDIPGFAWTGDFYFNLKMHYIFAFFLVFFAFYHVVYHVLMKEFDIFPKKGDFVKSYQVIKAMITGGEEPPSEKYLPEQRLAYVAIALTIALLIITGLIKSYKNILGKDISNELYFWAAQLHNLGMVLIILLIIVHLAAFIPKANRILLSGMFSGKVDAEYAKHRHSLWKFKIDKDNK